MDLLLEDLDRNTFHLKYYALLLIILLFLLASLVE